MGDVCGQGIGRGRESDGRSMNERTVNKIDSKHQSDGPHMARAFLVSWTAAVVTATRRRAARQNKFE